MLNIAKTRFSNALTFRSPEGGGGNGGGNPNPPKSLTLEQQLSKTRDDLSAVTAERDSLKTTVSTLTAERDALQSQFDLLKTAADEAKTNLTTTQAEVTKLQGDLSNAQAALVTANGNVSRLEAICGVRGLNSNQTPPVIENPDQGTMSAEAFEKRLKSAAPHERGAIAREFEQAVKEGKIK